MVKVRPDIPRHARYTTNEVCEILGISYRTLLRWVQAGYLRQRFSDKTSRPYYLGGDIVRVWDM